jgi:hypothetical protein
VYDALTKILSAFKISFRYFSLLTTPSYAAHDKRYNKK